MDLMVLMGIVLDLMETIMVSILVCDGFYWWDVKSCIWKMPKTHYKNELRNGFTEKSKWFIIVF